jgi:bacteriocin biosynthesis cyclodehydratase domain-containing protein
MSNAIFRIARRYQILASPGGKYRFISLTSALRVHSEEHEEVLAKILPLLANGVSTDSLLAAVGRESSARVLGLLDQLRSRGLVEELPPSASDAAEQCTDQDRFFDNFPTLGFEPPNLDAPGGPSPLPAQRKLADASVLVVGLGRVGSRFTCSLAQAGVGAIWGADPGVVTDEDLRDSGYEPASRDANRENWLTGVIGRINDRVTYRPLGTGGIWDPRSWRLPEALSLLVLCDDGFDPDRHDTINQICLDRALTWTSYRALGAKYEIGPTIVPRQTACFKCLELRKSANLDSYDNRREIWRSLAAQELSVGRLNITVGSDVLALEVIKILTGFSRPITYGSLYTFDLLTLEAAAHPVLKIPRCPQCSPAATSRPSLIIWPSGDGFEEL